MPVENCNSKRQPFDYPCWLGSSPTQPGRLLDISKGGAKVSLRNPSQIPDQVALYLTEDKSTGRDCRVAWRSDAEIGLEFLRSFSRFDFKPKSNVEM